MYEKTVEPELTGPVFVLDYPREVSPLARTHRDDPVLVERFEAVVLGRELGNAFSELNDPIDQRERFEAQEPSSPQPATTRPTGSTRTTCGRSSTASRPVVASVSASIGW